MKTTETYGSSDGVDFWHASLLLVNASGAIQSLIYHTLVMTNAFNFPGIWRRTFNMWKLSSCALRFLYFLSGAILILAGCSDRQTAQVQLHSRQPSPQAVMHLEITAQVAGAQTGLRYKWFSVSGGCNPQESDQPTTLFKFAD